MVKETAIYKKFLLAIGIFPLVYIYIGASAFDVSYTDLFISWSISKCPDKKFPEVLLIQNFLKFISVNQAKPKGKKKKKRKWEHQYDRSVSYRPRKHHPPFLRWSKAGTGCCCTVGSIDWCVVPSSGFPNVCCLNVSFLRSVTVRLHVREKV